MSNIHMIKKFSLLDKVLMGTGFYGMIIIAFYAIYLVSFTWVLIYLGVFVFGMLVLFGYCLCSHCPYPHSHSSCLFPPFGQVFKKIYTYRPGPLSATEKTGFWVIMIGIIVVMPQYWLLKNHALMALFWLLCLPTFAGFVFYNCKRCKCSYCPFNLAKDK